MGKRDRSYYPDSPRPGHGHPSDWIAKPYSIVFTGVVLFILIFGIAIFLGWRQFETTRNNALTADKTTVNLLADLILEHNIATIGILQSYAHRPLFIDTVKNKDLAGAYRHLSDLKKNAEIDLTFVTDKRGILWVNFPVFPESIGTDLSYRDWYKGISSRWKPYISTVFKLIVGEKPLAVAVCVPIFDEKERVIGILASSQRLGFLVDAMQKVPLSPYTTVNVIDRAGKILYSNKVPYQESITDYRFFPILGPVLKERKQQIEMNDPQKDHEKSYLTVVPVGDIGWTVIIERSQKDIYRSEFRRLIEIGAVSFLSFLLIIFFLVYLRKATLFRKTEELLQAEIKLRQSEENFHHSLDDSPMGVRIVTEKGKTIYANQAILDIYGYDSMEDLKTTPVEKRYTPESHADFLIRREKRQQGVDVSSEYTINIIRKDGEVRHLLVLRREVLWDGERQFQVLYNDITDRKRAEMVLRESEERLRTIIEASLDAIIAVNVEGRLILFNGAAQELFQYSEKEALNQPADILLREEIGKIHQERLEKFLKRGVGQCGHIGRRMEKFFRRKDGSLFEAEVSMSGGRSDGLRLVVFAIHDITERKRAEEALRSEKDFADSIIQTAQTIILLLDKTGHIVSINPYMETISGFPLKEVQGKDWFSTFLPEDVRNRVRELFLKAVSDIQTHGNVDPIVTKDGRKLQIEWYDKTLKDESGNVMGLLCIGQDVTERERAESEIQALARFPSENPNPVLRIARDGTLLYVNADGLSQLPEWHLQEGRCAPSMMRDVATEALNSGKSRLLDLEHCGRVYSFFVAPIAAAGYTNLYGRDITENKKTEEQLRESEEQYRNILESIEDGYFEVDLAGNFTFFNPSLCRILGYPREEMPGMNNRVFMDAENAKKVFRAFNEVYVTRIPTKGFEWETIRKDGARTYIEVSVSLIARPGKKPTGFRGIARDVTERKQKDEELHATARYARSLIEASLDPLVTISSDGKITDVNKTTEQVTGVSREVLVGSDFCDYFTEPDKAREGYQKVFSQGVVKDYPLTIRHSSGSTTDVLYNASVYKNEAGDVQGVFAAARDVTERKKMEGHLRESEEIMRYIVKHDPNAIAVYDRNLQYIAVSNRYLQDYDVKELDIIGKHHYEVFPEIPQRWKDVHLRCLAGATERNGDDYFERPDGSITYNRWECRPWHQPDGEIGGIITYTEVTTERKKAEEELRTSHLQLRALATHLQQIREEERLMIAREVHDEMGGELTGLKMDLSWMLRKMGDVDPGEARVALMDKIHTANALIDQMIRVVRRISTDLRPSVLDDLGLVAALEWQLSEFTSRTEIQHEFAPTFEYVNMEADTAVAVFRVFQEALTNVVRHSRATKVAVVFREGERSLFGDESFVLEIRDNGRGITEEEILNPKSLGLLGMKERVLTFGGELSIRGELGGGTALVLQIPRKQGEAL